MPAPIIIEVLNKAAGHLRQKGIENFRLDAQLLLGHVLNLDRIELYLNHDRPLTEHEVQRFRTVVRRRAAREPLQHILGSVRFRKLILKIDKRALIPRKETELLIDAVKTACGSLSVSRGNRSKISILDIGVGSGAILLSLLKEFPAAETEGVELDTEAICLTEENAALNNLKLEGNLKQGDMFSPFPPQKKWDIIVSNPPYVGRNEFDTLEPEVRFWDPPNALIGGETGIEYPSRLIQEAVNRINEQGFLLMEIGDTQSEILIREGKQWKWKNIRKNHDYSGKDRFLAFQK
jgi:release factor glutamine methyltransferase